MAVHECPLCGEICCCHGAGDPSRSDADRCFHVCNEDSAAFDFGGEDEPTGSCDDCGTNLYGDERFDGLCDQCSFTSDWN